MTPLRKSQHSRLAAIPDELWRLNRTESIAHLTGISWRIVHEFRRDNKKPKPLHLPRSGRPGVYDWTLFDPSLTDAENAAVIGCTALTAKYHRLKKLKIKKKRGPNRRRTLPLEPEPFV
jgi:hypothetical protein